MLLEYKYDPKRVKISAKLEYRNTQHIRTFVFDYQSEIHIYDVLEGSKNFTFNLMINPVGIIKVEEHLNNINFNDFMVVLCSKEKKSEFILTESKYSSEYNQFRMGKKIKYNMDCNKFNTVIEVKCNE